MVSSVRFDASYHAVTQQTQTELTEKAEDYNSKMATERLW